MTLERHGQSRRTKELTQGEAASRVHLHQPCPPASLSRTAPRGPQLITVIYLHIPCSVTRPPSPSPPSGFQVGQRQRLSRSLPPPPPRQGDSHAYLSQVKSPPPRASTWGAYKGIQGVAASKQTLPPPHSGSPPLRSWRTEYGLAPTDRCPSDSAVRCPPAPIKNVVCYQGWSKCVAACLLPRNIFKAMHSN